MRCQPGEQDFLHAKRHKQQVIDRTKRSHIQQIRSKLDSPATSSRESWWTIKQLTNGGGSTISSSSMMEEPSTSVQKIRLKYSQQSSARSAEWMIHLGFLQWSPASQMPVSSQFALLHISRNGWRRWILQRQWALITFRQ